MAYENFSSYTEVDEGTNVTVATNKVSWVDLDRDETSYLYKDKGANYFDGDFTHQFECQCSGRDAGNPLFAYWVLANDIGNLKTLVDAAVDYIEFHYRYDDTNGNLFHLYVVQGGVGITYDTYDGPTDNTTYYITIERDDDGGANGTGQIKAYIRTGSHSGTLVDTLSADCAAGEQNDYRYIYALCSYDTASAGEDASGYTERLDLTPNTIKPSTLAMTATLHAPTVAFPIQTALPATLALEATLHAPTVVIDCTVTPATLAMEANLHGAGAIYTTGPLAKEGELGSMISRAVPKIPEKDMSKVIQKILRQHYQDIQTLFAMTTDIDRYEKLQRDHESS